MPERALNNLFKAIKLIFNSLDHTVIFSLILFPKKCTLLLIELQIEIHEESIWPSIKAHGPNYGDQSEFNSIPCLEKAPYFRRYRFKVVMFHKVAAQQMRVVVMKTVIVDWAGSFILEITHVSTCDLFILLFSLVKLAQLQGLHHRVPWDGRLINPLLLRGLIKTMAWLCIVLPGTPPLGANYKPNRVFFWFYVASLFLNLANNFFLPFWRHLSAQIRAAWLIFHAVTLGTLLFCCQSWCQGLQILAVFGVCWQLILNVDFTTVWYFCIVELGFLRLI